MEPDPTATTWAPYRQVIGGSLNNGASRGPNSFTRFWHLQRPTVVKSLSTITGIPKGTYDRPKGRVVD